MSCWTKSQLEDMLYDVVQELDLSDETMERHSQEGTEPYLLVRMVLEQKDREIRMLKQGMKQIEVSPAQA